MSATVDLDRLADALSDYGFAYLITVGDDYRAHTTSVTPVLGDGVIDVGAVGRHTRANLARRSDATLVWPPQEPGGYSLIVDGHAEVPEDADPTGGLRIVPTAALLHRLATDSPAPAGGYTYDCVKLEV